MCGIQGKDPETYHLTCPICSVLPQTSSIDDHNQELTDVHSSRRVRIAERYHSRHVTGWKTPELAECQRREYETPISKESLSDLKPGLDAAAVLWDRRPRGSAEPTGGPGIVSDTIPVTANDPESTSPAAARGGAAAENSCPPAIEDARDWLAGYLGQYPKGVAVPRQILRDIADRRWTAADSGPVPISQAQRLRLLMEGRSATMTKGRRSSKRLTSCLRSLEAIGLISRDNARDAIIITDPGALRRLGDDLRANFSE